MNLRVSALAFLATLLMTGAASAQLRIDVGVQGGGAWMPSAPPVNIQPDIDTSGIRFPNGDTPRLRVPLGFVGIGAYSSVKLSRLVYMPILGGTYWGAVGPSPRITTAVDGTFVELRPYRASMFDVSILGIGLQAPLKRWLVTADITAGFSVLWIPGTVAAGNVIEETTASAFSPTIRINLVGCRRFDPWTRMCVVLAPNVYNFGFLNGGTLTLRWEIGS